jgi:hypothetical protein
MTCPPHLLLLFLIGLIVGALLFVDIVLTNRYLRELKRLQDTRRQQDEWYAKMIRGLR